MFGTMGSPALHVVGDDLVEKEVVHSFDSSEVKCRAVFRPSEKQTSREGAKNRR
jgi:hypothetical protein